jgi:hypothetical protein
MQSKVILALKTKLRSCRNLTAFGLVEVLIGLAITGGVLISITSIAVSAAQMVKNNEIGDFANNLMLVGVEYFKAPAQDSSKPPGSFLSTINNNAPTKIFKIQTIDLSRGIDSVSLATVSVIDVNPLSDCSIGNNFRVTIADTKYIVCNKIVVEKEGSGFIITSYITYRTMNGELRSAKIVGYRQGI